MPETPAMPEPDGGWRSRWARRRAEQAFALDLRTDARKRSATQKAVDRKAGRAQEPLTWPMRIVAGLVGVVVLAVAAVIALVVVGAQIGFYDTHLGSKNISFSALGVDTPLNLPTFTPLATEGVVWAFTLLAVVMVLLGRTATIWTQSMWFFATIAATVNTWYSIGDEHDLFGGAIRGGLSLAGPYLVHMFILWCRHLHSGKSLAQARADMDIRWQAITRRLGAVLFVALQHLRHPTIAGRAFGYWLGVDGWGYRAAWRAASIEYRMDVQKRLDNARRSAAGGDHSGGQEVAGDAAVVASGDAPPAPPVVADEPPDDAPTTGGVLLAERPAIDEAEIDRLVAQMNDPNFTWETATDQPGSATTGGDQNATTRRPRRALEGDHEATTDAPAGDHDDDHGTSQRRPARRPQRARGRGQKVAGMRRGGRAKPAATVDISGLLPVAREVATQLGDELKRERLLKGLRERGHSVGGQRRDALWEAIKAERARGATDE